MGFADKLKDLVGKETSSSGSNTTEQQSGGGAPGQASGQAAGSEDYGDKALDFVEGRTGHKLNRDTNEKITDGVRGFYEKQTGSKVDSKWSN